MRRAVHRPGFLLFLDVETSGLDPERHEIIQVAAVVVDRAFKEHAWLEYKLPFDEVAAEQEALDMNHYDPEVWAKKAVDPLKFMGHLEGICRTFASVRMVAKRTGKPFFVAQMAGHNAERFDFEFLKAMYKRLDRFLPIAFRVLDTAQLATLYLHETGAVEDTKLQTLAKHFGINPGDEHDALSDLCTNVEVYRRLREELRKPAVTASPEDIF
jgi:DNA polymerase-3 subunit epsilon